MGCGISVKVKEPDEYKDTSQTTQMTQTIKVTDVNEFYIDLMCLKYILDYFFSLRETMLKIDDDIVIKSGTNLFALVHHTYADSKISLPSPFPLTQTYNALHKKILINRSVAPRIIASDIWRYTMINYKFIRNKLYELNYPTEPPTQEQIKSIFRGLLFLSKNGSYGFDYFYGSISLARACYLIMVKKIIASSYRLYPSETKKQDENFRLFLLYNDKINDCFYRLFLPEASEDTIATLTFLPRDVAKIIVVYNPPSNDLFIQRLLSWDEFVVR